MTHPAKRFTDWNALNLCLLCRHQPESVAATLRRHVPEQLGRDLQLGQLRHQRLGGQPDRRLSRVQLQPPVADPRLELHLAGNGRQDHRGHRQEQDSRRAEMLEPGIEHPLVAIVD